MARRWRASRRLAEKELDLTLLMILQSGYLALLISSKRFKDSDTLKMTLLDPNDRRPVHFVGIAGAGMSALAELFVRRGVVVTGCDAAGDPTGDLGKLGIAVSTGHDPS